MLTPNPNECNSTLMSVTRGTYPYLDTYIYKCSLVVWNLDKTLLLLFTLHLGTRPTHQVCEIESVYCIF